MGILKNLLFLGVLFCAADLYAFPEVGDVVRVSDGLNYKIVSELGSGAYGRVFKAQMNTRQDSEIAIKIFFSNKDIESIFSNYEFVRDKAHDAPYFVKIYSTYRAVNVNGQTFPIIAMEKLDKDLWQLSKDLNLEQRIEIAPKIIEDILRAIAFLAKHKRAHSDIRMENIMCRGSGQFLLNDFDLSGPSEPTILDYFLDPELVDERPGIERDVYNLGQAMLGFLFGEAYLDRDLEHAVQAFERTRSKLESRYLLRFDLLRAYITGFLHAVPQVRISSALEEFDPRNANKGIGRLIDYTYLFRMTNLTCPDLFPL